MRPNAQKQELGALRNHVTKLAIQYGTKDYLDKLRASAKDIAAYFAVTSHQDILTELCLDAPEGGTKEELNIRSVRRAESKFLELLFLKLITPDPATDQIPLMQFKDFLRDRIKEKEEARYGIIPARGHRRPALDELMPPNDNCQYGSVDNFEKIMERRGVGI